MPRFRPRPHGPDLAPDAACAGASAGTLGGALARALAPAGLALLLAACGRAPERTPDVLLITVDTLRADALGCYGHVGARTPHIDALAAAGTRFLQAYSPRGVTLPSLTTINTGVSPLSHGVLSQSEALPEQIPTLAQTLKARGYRTAAFVTNVCGAIVEHDGHIGRGYDVRTCTHGEKLDSAQYEWDERAVNGAVEWLAGVRRDEPVLLWVHMMDPHGDHVPRPGLYTGDPRSPLLLKTQTQTLYDYEQRGEVPPATLLDDLWDLYDAEVEGSDQQVGRLLAAFRQARPDDAVVVFTGDHGEELFEHNAFLGHGESIHDTVLHVPLVISAPGRVPAGGAVEAIVQLEDVSPTILDLLGLPAEPRMEGRSLRTLAGTGRTDDGPRMAFGSRYRDVLTIRTPRYRFVRNLLYPTAQEDLIEAFAYRARFDFFQNEEMLFDVERDPDSQHDLLAGDGASDPEVRRVRDALNAELMHWLATRKTLAADQGTIFNEKLREELQALGYADFLPQDEQGR